jgi:ribosomal protein S18 acetylase RimI-like enzyme
MTNSKDIKALQIRGARECDILDLVSLEKECFDTYYQEHRFNEAEFVNYLRKKKAIFLVAILDSFLVGYVVGLVRTSQSQLSASLDSIAVLLRSRGSGVGDQLMQRFIEEAKRRACKRIMLDVAAPNENGIRFFSRRGFQRIRCLPAYYGKELDGILMKLDI